eukprot:351969-Chlamydomonas_euryale.AAC.1
MEGGSGTRDRSARMQHTGRLCRRLCRRLEETHTGGSTSALRRAHACASLALAHSMMHHALLAGSGRRQDVVAKPRARADTPCWAWEPPSHPTLEACAPLAPGLPVCLCPGD